MTTLVFQTYQVLTYHHGNLLFLLRLLNRTFFNKHISFLFIKPRFILQKDVLFVKARPLSTVCQLVHEDSETDAQSHTGDQRCAARDKQPFCLF